MKDDFVEKSDYVIDTQGGLLISPNVLDYFKNKYKEKKYHNNHLIYIFINKEVPGIKFYNLSSDYDKKKYFEFITKKNLITEANWDFLINYPNHTMIFKSDVGNIKIDTFILDKEKMFKILDNIKKNDEIIYIKIKKPKLFKK